MADTETAETDTKAAPRPRTIDVGWMIDASAAGFIFDEPRPIGQKAPPAQSAKALQNCPAVVHNESRHYAVPCPVSLHLRLARNEAGQVRLVNAAGLQSTVDPQKIGDLARLVDRRRWRAPDRPVLEISTPYRFVADEPVWMETLPPFHAAPRPAWPGVLIGTRTPIHLWPGMVRWVFEWADPDRDLVLRRGDPWLAFDFQADAPHRALRFMEAEMTPELREYCIGIDGISRYTGDITAALETAQSRRPERLLHPRPATA